MRTLAHTMLDEIRTTGQCHAQATPVAVSAEALEGVPYGAIMAQQGDLYFAKLAAVPADAVPWPFRHGQLAPGTTQGSRHCVDLTQVRLWLLPHPSPLDGPMIEAPAGCVITHPEHGHLRFPPGLYQVTFQRTYAAELRRSVD